VLCPELPDTSADVGTATTVVMVVSGFLMIEV